MHPGGGTIDSVRKHPPVYRIWTQSTGIGSQMRHRQISACFSTAAIDFKQESRIDTGEL